MARHKPIDTSPRFIAVDLQQQRLSGTFEHALNHLIDHEIDLSGFDARYKNDPTGANFGRQAAKLEAAAQTKLHSRSRRTLGLNPPSPSAGPTSVNTTAHWFQYDNNA